MHEKHIEIRWRDLDAYRHVNNAVYATYLEECRDELVENALAGVGDPWDFVLARVAIDYRRELTQDDDAVVVRCTVERIGNSSITLREEIRTIGGELAAEARPSSSRGRRPGARGAHRGRARLRAPGRGRRERARRVVGAGSRASPPPTRCGGGVEVVVLEARDRVGGRVWSRELDNGAVVEMGAEFILPGNDTHPRLRRPLRARAVGQGHALRRSRATRRDRRRSRRPCRPRSAQIGEALPGLDARRHRPPRCSTRLPLDPGASEAIQARLEVSCAATADRVAATALAGLAAHSDDVCPSVAGGNQRVALALAAGLGDSGSALEPGRPGRLGRGRRRRLGRRRRARGRPSGARRAGQRRRPDRLRPVRSPSRSASPMPPSSYGHAAKLFVPLDRERRRRAPCSRCRSATGRWTATAADGVQPVVNAFAGSAPALAGLRVADGPETWLASLARLRPDLALAPEHAVLVDVGRRPVGRAARTRREARPPAAWAPAGPFHVCGEHTHDTSRALMDGALASGVRAAREIGGTAVVSPPRVS